MRATTAILLGLTALLLNYNGGGWTAGFVTALALVELWRMLMDGWSRRQKENANRS